MTDDQPDVESLFLEALRLKTEIERQKFLESKCGDDSEMLAHVNSLLEANAAMGSFMDQTQSHIQTANAPEQLGEQIGVYQLIDQLGEGGMGVVYIAEQREPVRRRVALKIIKPGMDTKEVMARFAAERQALALMDHPNIAKVLDAGETEKGRPFFVMEMVKGVAITTFCDQNRLSYRERLELFVDVCKAIQHAHQKGVIHRDIKPSNVLVSIHDDKPVVKVIDFGVAKAIHQPLTDETVYTRVSQLVGTPLYMSPEQAGMDGLDVDTRSDIYSLGVLLYELLTGQTPFDRGRLRKAAIEEIRRIIREEEPPKPSTRISTLGESATTVSEHRQMDPKKMRQELRGEIDWIVMKSLEKDRKRRYETANGMALDIQRYLNAEPVLACPPSQMYRLSKFVRRNRTAVVMGSLIISALVLGVIGFSTGMFWALKEKKRADKAAEIAVAKESTTRKILTFMVDLFEEASPQKRLGKPMTVTEFLDVGANRIDELDDEPDTQAMLKETIGSLYVVLSDFKKSEPLLLDAYRYRQQNAEVSERDEIAFGSVCASLAVLYSWTEPDKAEKFAERAAKIFESRLGDSPELADSLNAWGNSLQRQSKIPESLKVHQRSLAVREKLYPPGHPKRFNVATAHHNIGIAHFFNNDLEKAETHYRRAIEIEAEHLPADDPELATAKHVLSIVYANQSKLEYAKQFQAESFATRTKVFDANHDHVGLSSNWMGNIWRELGHFKKSEPLLRRAIEIHTEVFGPEDDLVFWDQECLLKTLIKLEKYEEALELQKALANRASKGNQFVNQRSVNVLLGDILAAQGKFEASRKTYLNTAKLMAEPGSGKDSYVGVAMLKAAAIDARLNRAIDQNSIDAAIKLLTQSQKWADDDARLLSLRIAIADQLFESGKKDEASRVYRDVADRLAELVQPVNVDLYLVDFAANFFLTCRQQSIRDNELGLELAERVSAEVKDVSPHYLKTLAIALYANGQPAMAEKSIDQAIQLLPEESVWLARFKDLQEELRVSN